MCLGQERGVIGVTQKEIPLMKAMVATAFGGPEVLERQDVDPPEPKARELMVKVMATAVNPVDYKIREQGGAFG